MKSALQTIPINARKEFTIVADPFVHPCAVVDDGASIGPRTRVGAFAHVLPGARIGADCNIGDGVFIESDVAIGARVIISSGVQVLDGTEIDDEVVVGPNATFTYDPGPSSRERSRSSSRTRICHGATIGANATILPGLMVDRGAIVGAGAVVIHNVPANAIVVGNPARIQGYATSEPKSITVAPMHLKGEKPDCAVESVHLLYLPTFEDMRGRLSVAEFGQLLPFQPQRCFMVYDVPSKDVRGEHAHKALHQFLVCIHGACTVMVDDGRNRATVILDRPEIGMHVPPMVWAAQYGFSPETVLLVLASAPYDSSDYIRDYADFLALVSR